MGWFDRADSRNQRRAQRDNDRYRSEQADEDDVSVTEAAGTYGSFLRAGSGCSGQQPLPSVVHFGFGVDFPTDPAPECRLDCCHTPALKRRLGATLNPLRRMRGFEW